MIEAMKTMVPNYYGKFACIAGECRHSCCIGWEIDIDDESLARFQRTGGKTGDRLRESILTDAEGAHFLLDKNDRCPFLNKGGLCDLILELGEDHLCQICADHPRFRNFFSDRTEIGLGLCCEVAGQLILRQTAPVRLITLADDGLEEAQTKDEELLLHLRSVLIAAIQDRGLPFEARIEKMLRLADLPSLRFSLPEWAQFLLTLERLDEAWAQRLRALDHAPTAPFPCLPELEIPLEQLAVYLLMRHLPGALEDGDLRGRVAYVALILMLVNALCAVRPEECGKWEAEELVEIARMYSSEIEYSDENLCTILDELHRAFPGMDE